MTKRVEGTTTFTQAYNVDNRLTAITRTGGLTLTQQYDADGARVRKTEGPTTTLYLGAAVEVQIRGAMRVTTGTITGTVTWLHGDDPSLRSGLASGAKVAGSDARYTPFGEYRTGLAGAGNASDNRFTDQKRLTAGWGLDDFNARMYSAVLARFVSADTIVPGAGEPQALNRYSYVGNRPLGYRDPTGHCDVKADRTKDTCWLRLDEIEKRFSNVKIQGEIYDLVTLNAIADGLEIMLAYFGSQDALYRAIGAVSFIDPDDRRFLAANPACASNSGCTLQGISSLRVPDYRWSVHEIAHLYDFNTGYPGLWFVFMEPGLSASAYGNTAGPWEDFAETVTWAAWHDARGAGLLSQHPSDRGLRDPSKTRIDAVYTTKRYIQQLTGLNVALAPSPTYTPTPTATPTPLSTPQPPQPNRGPL